MSIKARMRVNERMICADGIEPATEAFGHPAHPPVLSDNGRGMSSMPWREDFWESIKSRTSDDMDEIYGSTVRRFPGCPIRCAEVPEDQWTDVPLNRRTDARKSTDAPNPRSDANPRPGI